MKKKLDFGRSQSHKLRTLALEWDKLYLNDGHEFGVFARQGSSRPSLQRSGVYSFDGSQDGHPGGCILYIGKADRQSLATEIQQQLQHVRWPGQVGVSLMADVWNVTVRWAVIEEIDLIACAEEILIRHHAPAFNGNYVRGKAKNCGTWSDVILLNAAAKGPLLPVAAGLYFDMDAWPDE